MNNLALTPEVKDMEARVSLDGLWRVSKWPFDQDERRLVAPHTDDSAWTQLQQPGKVFYADPKAEKGETPDYVPVENYLSMVRTAQEIREREGRHVTGPG